MAIAALLLKVWLPHYWGISGVIWATVFACSGLVATPWLIYTRRLLAAMEVAPAVATEAP